MKAHQAESAIRADRTLKGKAAYDASCAALPRYHDGTLRRSWEDLSPVAQLSWTL